MNKLGFLLTTHHLNFCISWPAATYRPKYSKNFTNISQIKVRISWKIVFLIMKEYADWFLVFGMIILGFFLQYLLKSETF